MTTTHDPSVDDATDAEEPVDSDVDVSSLSTRGGEDGSDGSPSGVKSDAAED